MTNKEIVQDLLRRIPDDASLQDIAREIEFVAAIRQGFLNWTLVIAFPSKTLKDNFPPGLSSRVLPLPLCVRVSSYTWAGSVPPAVAGGCAAFKPAVRSAPNGYAPTRYREVVLTLPNKLILF